MSSLTPRSRLSRSLSRTAVSAVLVSGLALAQSAPTPFTYIVRTGVATNTVVTSEARTVTGFEGTLAVSVAGGTAPQYKVGGGAYTSNPGLIGAGQTLTVRHTSSSDASTETLTTVTVGSYSTEFKSVTGTTDRTPDGFDFGTVLNTFPNTLTQSQPQVLEGFNASVSIIAGPGAQYSFDGVNWTNASGTLNPGQALTMRHLTSSTAMAYTKTYVKVGGITGYFTTRNRSNTNQLPVADAGADQAVDENAAVRLDGSASADAEGPVSYSWEQVDGPDVTLSNANTVTPGFTAPGVSGDETLTFELTVTDDVGATASDQVQVTVIDARSLSIADAQVDEAAGTVELTVTVSPAAAKTITVDYATADVTARNGSDYVGGEGALTIPPGAETALIVIPITADSFDENDETFTLGLSNPQGATIENGIATVTILDDDTSNLLRVGAARRNITPAQAHIDGVEEARAFGVATHLQKFNLGGFGINPLSNIPDDPAGLVQIGNESLTEPASNRLFTNSQGHEEHTQVRALAIEQTGGSTVVFVMIDAVGAGNIIQKNLKAAVIAQAATLGVTLAPGNILFGQTHTHAGADLQGLWGGVPQAWIEDVLYPAAAAAVREALATRQPSHVRLRQGNTVQFNNYRRPRSTDPDADADGTLTLISATADDGTPVGSILQYNAHPTSVNVGGNRIPHADYILGAMEWLEDAARLGGVSLYYNGPIADASGSSSRAGCAQAPQDQPYSGVRCRGEGMADYLLDPANALADRELAPTLEARAVEAYLPVTNPGFLAFGLTGSFNRYYNFMDVATDMIPGIAPFIADLPQLTPVARTHVSRVTLGGAEDGLEIVTIPGEATNTFGQYIRGLAKTNVMLLGLTHNSFGYIIPEEEFSYVDQEGDDGLVAPFTGYEENVSLGPLTAPMLRTQAYNPLFDAAPEQDVPPAVAACLSDPASTTCVTTVAENRLNALLQGIEACIEGGPRASGCPLQTTADFFEAVFDGWAVNCRSFGGPEELCGIFEGTGEIVEPDVDARVVPLAADAMLRGCDILDPSHCLLPFPSDHFTVAAAPNSIQDKPLGTGRRIDFNMLAMPRNAVGKPIDPTEWNRNDGFSPGQQIFTFVPNVATIKDAAGKPIGPVVGAPPITNIGASLDVAGSSVVVLDAETGLPHPVWAEIDLNAGYLLPADQIDNPDPTKAPRPALIVRPGKNFAEGHRYVVVLKNLKDDTTGATIPAGVAFRACRDGVASALPPVQARCAQLADKVFPVLEEAGIAVEGNSSLYLAWDFTVASADNNIARLRHMRDDAFVNYLGQVENADGSIVNLGRAPKFKVTQVSESSGERTVQGSFTIPSYVVPADPSPLEQERDIRQQLKEQFPQFAAVLDGFNSVPRQAWTVSAPPNRLFYNPADAPNPDDPMGQRYGDGLPDRTGEMTATFTCRFPRNASATTRPIVYGHGLLGGQEERGADHEYDMMYCKADWFGFAFGDIPNVVTVLADVSNFPVIPDGSQQGMLNQLFFARLLRHPQGFVADPAFRDAGGQPLFDNREVFYDGNSQGGILGGVVVAMSKDITRGVLGVVGMNYSTLLQRSVDYDGQLAVGIPPYSLPTYLGYQDDLDRQLVFSIMQMLWDRSENNGYAHHLTDNSALKGPDKQVLLHSAFADHQVTHWSAQVMARTVGVDVADMYQRKPGEGVTHTFADKFAFFAQRDPDSADFWDLPLVGRNPGVAYDTADCAGTDCRTTRSGFVEFDEGRTAIPPIGNVPPRADDFDPHGYPRGTIFGRCQKSHFLHTQGRLIDVRGERNVTSAANCPALPAAVDPPPVGVAEPGVPPFPVPMCMPEGLPFAGECLPDELQEPILSLWNTINGGSSEPPPDGDGDGVADSADNCPTVANANQANADGDAQGDACDADDDNDGIGDGADQCPTQAGPAENNGCPVAPPDGDGDGVPDEDDDCPTEPGPESNNGCPEETAEFPLPMCMPEGLPFAGECLPDELQEPILSAWETITGAGGGLPSDVLPDACDPVTGENCFSELPAPVGDLFDEDNPVGGGEPPDTGEVSQLIADATANAQTLPDDLAASIEQTLDNAADGTLVDRSAEAVVMEGRSFPDWSQPAAQGIAMPYPNGALTGDRDAHAGIMLYPPPGFTGVPTAAPVREIVAYKRDGGAWIEIPVQVDERFPYFLANPNSDFGIYSGTDMELTYAWDRELWKAIGACFIDPTSVAPTPDPVVGLDDDDEIAFMARDAGAQADPTIAGPADTVGAGQEIALADPFNPDMPKFVYLFRKSSGPTFSEYYVTYARDANADQWIDRSFFEGGPETDPLGYRRENLGTSNTGYGPNVGGPVCWDGVTQRASNDRFPRDGVTVSTDKYELYASGRWMVRDVKIAKPGQPRAYGADIVDRWKGRAFQQSPDSTVSLVGFEDEQVNWEANSALLGERVGPVRAIREIWGADSGTNVTKTETYYSDAYVYRYRMRVHPIPPDGIYTSWDYNRGAMVASGGDDPAKAGRYFTAVRGTGVPIDGVNDDVGNVDGVGSTPAYFDVADPTLNLPLGMYNWEQVAAKNDLGSLVYLFELKSATIGPNSAVIPYYRDDACLDDGTGDDPVQRPFPGEAYEWEGGRVADAYDALAGRALDHSGATFADCTKRQGAHAQHGIHMLLPPETDNAFAPVPVDEVDGQQWAFPVPMSAPANVGERYANIVRVPLVRVVKPRPSLGGGGGGVPTDYGTCVAMAAEGGDAQREAAARFTCAVIFGGGRGEGETAEDEIQGPNTYVPMEDGTLIAANVYIPWACNKAKNPDAVPCASILEMSGYESGSDEGQTPAGDFNDILGHPTVGGEGMPLTGGTRAAHETFYKSGERYVSVTANVRGTGCSAGEFDLFSRKSAEDGKYLIDEWMAKQAWSNGKVGVFGHSYSGITGAMIASTNPKQLRMVSISGQIGDVYRDITYPGGVSNYGFPLLWTAGVRPAYDYLGATFAGLIADSPRSDDDPIGRQCAQNQAARSRTTEDPLIQGLSDTDSPWFQERSVVNYLHAVRAPTQIVTAYQDEQTGPRGGTNVFDHLPQNLTRRLVMLNGDHGSQTELISDPDNEVVDQIESERMFWIDRFMLDANDPIPARRPRAWAPAGRPRDPVLPEPQFADDGTATSRVLLDVVDVGATSSDGHVDSTGFPLAQTQWTDFYFQSDGTLDASANTVQHLEAGSGSSWLNGSKRQAYSYQAGTGTGAQATAADAGGAEELIFSLNIDDVAQPYGGEPLNKVWVIAGPIVADLFITSTGADTELMVQLIDVNTFTGERMYLQRGVLRASHDAIEVQHSQCAAYPAGGRIMNRDCTLADNIYRPHRAHTAATPITPGQVRRYRLEIFPVGHVFRAEHQLLVKIHAPSADDNDWAYIAKTAPALNTLHHSAQYPSSIRLPVIPLSAVSLNPDAGYFGCALHRVRCVTVNEPGTGGAEVPAEDQSADWREECHDFGEDDPTPGKLLKQLICGTFDFIAETIPWQGSGGGSSEPGPLSQAAAAVGGALNTVADAYQGVIGSDGTGASEGRVLAGVGVVDMTPDVGYGAGQYSPGNTAVLGAATGGDVDPYVGGKKQEPAYGVQSRLTGRAIVIEGSNGKRIALLKSDNYLAQDYLVRRIGQILADKGSSIGYDQILYGVTHAHSSTYLSSPSVGVWVFQDAFDARFFEFQARKLADAILLAEANLQPARMGATTVHHRVYKGNVVRPHRADDNTPAGYPREFGDHGLVVMRFDTDEAEPKPLAVWINWGQHPEGLDGYSLHSPDYVGALERFVDRELGAPMVFSQGDVGSAENSGSTSQRIRDDGTVCAGPGATAGGCPAGQGVQRDWQHAGHAQGERGARFLGDAVVKGWKVIGGEQEADAPVAGARPNNYVPSVQVPMSSGFPVDYRNAWVPGPLSHPYPGVSACRTETTAEGNPGVPNAADCAHPRDDSPDTEASMVWQTLKAHGIPVPENYDLPAFGTVEENLRLRLQAFRVGDIVLGSSASEAQVDLILNFESRANDVEGDIYNGFDWACLLPEFKDDPEYTAACALQEQYFDPAEFHWDLAPHTGATSRDPAAIARMRAQVHNDARGWDAPEYVPYANGEPADITQIKGNFTREELPAAQGYKLAVGIGHAGDYNGYTVSYREYMAYDDYRKALTSYGAHTADYMVTRMVRMAGAMKGAPELKPEPHDAFAQADEARQVAASTALGRSTAAAYESFLAALPPDVGPAEPIADQQPSDIGWFEAATFTWRGGSTAVDNPQVVVERCHDDVGSACEGGTWRLFAGAQGEVQTRVQPPQGAAGLAATYGGQQEWLWTANFEAFEGFPARLGATPAGLYRFVVEGCINDFSAPAASVTSRITSFLSGMLPDAVASQVIEPAACRSGATPYGFQSDGFEVVSGADRVQSVATDGNGNLAITVADRSIPKTYESGFRFVNAGDDFGTFCKECSFRPWAYSSALPAAVSVVVDGVPQQATGSGTSWTAAVAIDEGASATITVTYADGRVSRPFVFTRAGGGPVDTDGDGIPDGSDNCPNASNPGQEDNDSDQIGNVCDSTPDGEPAEGPGFPVPLCDPFGFGCITDLPGGQAVQDAADEAYNTVDGIVNGGGEPPVDPSGVLVPASDEIDANSTGGNVYQIYLPSADNGEVIAFSVFEPASFGGTDHALVLQGHGYGLKRSHTPDGMAGDPRSPIPTSGAQFGFTGGLSGDMTQFVAAGFWVISIDQRGFGESEGTVRLMDPEHEGSNLLQILDWAEANLPHLMYRTESDHPNYDARGNLVLGATGGSYGGGYQMLILAIDPKERLDAITPQITWHDLVHSLSAGGVAKSGYAVALAGLGELSSRGRQDQFIRDELLIAAQRNALGPQLKEALRYHSPKYWCGGGFGEIATDGVSDEGVPFRAPKPLPKVDALIFQGMHDALFNISEAIDTYECLKARGGDVRLHTYQFAHVWPSGTDMYSATPFASCNGANCLGLLTQFGPDDASASNALTCGKYQMPVMELEWLKAKLQGAASALVAAAPETCFALDMTADGVTLGSRPRDGGVARTTVNIPTTNVTLNALQPQPVALKLITLTANRVLAGIPKATITLKQVVEGSPLPGPVVVDEAGIDDPIVFVGLSRSRFEYDYYCDANAAQGKPFFCAPVLTVENTAGISLTTPSYLELIDDQIMPIRGFGTHTLDLQGVGERLAKGEQIQLMVFGYHPLYVVSGSRQAATLPLQISGTVSLPLLGDLAKLQ